MIYYWLNQIHVSVSIYSLVSLSSIWSAAQMISVTQIYSLNSGFFLAAAAASLQSCPTLCDPIDGSPPGPAVPGILQARTLEWVAISS